MNKGKNGGNEGHKIRTPKIEVARPYEDADLMLERVLFEEKDPKGQLVLIKELLTKILDADPKTKMPKIIFDLLEEIPLGKEVDPKDVLIGGVTYLTLSKPSKKKMIMYKIKIYFAREYDSLSEHEQRQISKKKFIIKKRKEFKEKMENVCSYKEMILNIYAFNSVVNHNERQQIMLEYMDLFHNRIVDNNAAVNSLMAQIMEDVNFQDYETMKEVLIKGGVHEKMVGRLFRTNGIYSNDDNGYASADSIFGTAQNNLPYSPVRGRGIEGFEKTHEDGFTNFNFHMIPLDIINGYKQFGENKTKEIYKKYFFAIIKLFVEGFKGILPVFNNIVKHRSIILNSINKKSNIIGFYGSESEEKPENIEIFQNTIVWEADELDEDEFKQLGLLLKEIVGDLNVVDKGYKDFDTRLTFIEDGEYEYIGYFVLNSGFEDTNIILMKDKKTGKQYIRLCLVGTDQDEYIYLTTQISRFIKAKKFINQALLYANIYHQYNVTRLSEQEIFDIEGFNEQYTQLFKSLIYPLTKEYKELHGEFGKALNTMLVGLYGTGKSQFLLNLMNRKRFKFGKKTYHLNANVLSLTVSEFMNLLGSDVSFFKNRLAEIYNNTSLPILLVIEDLDTLTQNEKDLNMDPGQFSIINQAMTLFFDGLGSLPVKVITTSNYPQRFSSRLIRPNRMENIIDFVYPLPKELREKIIKTHAKKCGIKLSKKRLQKYVDKTEKFTASHIASFIDKVKRELDFIHETTGNGKLTDELLEQVFDTLLVPVTDLQSSQETIKKWLATLTQNGGNKIGFGQDKK